MDEYVITLFWDDEASVWIAESPDIPGLILESHSFDDLIERVKIAVPELLEVSGTRLPEVKLHFKAEHLAVVA
jgi:predicted RNase H-like HicB family nuclease